MTEERREGHRHTMGNRVPVFIKLAWFILVVWIIWYTAYYAVPDFRYWITK